MISINSSYLFGIGELAKADSLFSRRNKRFDKEKMLADSFVVNEAINSYQKVIKQSNNSKDKLEAVWKLMQAYYFKGNFTVTSKNLKKKNFSKGIKIGETYIDVFPQSPEIYCWLGILWGYWAEIHSKLSAVRKGVPNKIKTCAEKTIELDEFYLEGGGYRMLGMVHFKVPKIPLFLNWPSKKKSLTCLEKAYKIGPDNLLNKYYLAEVLLDQNQKDHALKLLLDIIQTEQIKHGLAIDTWIKNQAKSLLQKHYQ